MTLILHSLFFCFISHIVVILYRLIYFALGDWLRTAIWPLSLRIILGPIPQPKSTLSFPFTSIKPFIPVSVLVSTMDFYFTEHDNTKGQSDLFSLSKSITSIMELPETANFLMVYPVFRLNSWILPSFVPKTQRLLLRVKHRKEHTKELFIKIFSISNKTGFIP